MTALQPPAFRQASRTRVDYNNNAAWIGHGRYDMNLSFEEARSIIESAFEPWACACSQQHDDVRVRIYDANTDATLKVVTASPGDIASVRAVSQFILEVRQSLAVDMLRKMS
jgi:hypothetical protein